MDIADRADSEITHYLENQIFAHKHRVEKEQSAVNLSVTKRYCVDCGEEIPQERILAVPHTVRCVHCQHILERNTHR